MYQSISTGASLSTQEPRPIGRAVGSSNPGWEDWLSVSFHPGLQVSSGFVNLGASSWNSVSTQSLAFLQLRIDTKNSNALPFNSTLEITELFPFPTCERVNGIDADGNPTDYRTRVGKYFLQNPLMIDIHASSLKPLSSAKAISLQPTGGQLDRIES